MLPNIWRVYLVSIIKVFTVATLFIQKILYYLLIMKYIVFFKLSSLLNSLKQSYEAVQKMKFSVKDFYSKCDQIRRKLRICSHLLKKS